MVPIWNGIALLHSKDERSLSRDKATRFCDSLQTHLNGAVVKAVRNAILEGPIGMESDRKDGEYKGAFLKRVQKFLWTNYDIQFDDKKNTLSNIFTSIQQGVIKQDMWGQLVPKMYWTPGDFGDGGSCFWGGHSINRYFLSNWEKFRALNLFYRSREVREGDEKQCAESHKNVIHDGNLLSGCGRALCAIDFPHEDCFTVWNAYGLPLETCVAAFIEGLRTVNPDFVDTLETYKDVLWRNFANNGSWFYTNNNKAWVVGPPAQIAKVRAAGQVDLGVKKAPDWSDFEEYLGKCTECRDHGVFADQKHFKHGSFCLCGKCVGKNKFQVSKCPCGSEIVIAPHLNGRDGVAKVYVDDDGKKLDICQSCWDMDTVSWDTGHFGIPQNSRMSSREPVLAY